MLFIRNHGEGGVGELGMIEMYNNVWSLGPTGSYNPLHKCVSQVVKLGSGGMEAKVSASIKGGHLQ